MMKKPIRFVALLLLSLLTATMAWSQNLSVMDQLKADPRKAYGTDYPYEQTDNVKLTKAPKGYKAFYISHYGRHGSRYYWNAFMYLIENVGVSFIINTLRNGSDISNEDKVKIFDKVLNDWMEEVFKNINGRNQVNG